MRVTLLMLWLWLLPGALLAESSVWRVDTPQGALYVAGSIHVLRAADYPLPPEFEAAYADSRVLVLETDLDAEAQAAAQQAILSRGFYAAGDGLQRHLSPALYARLAAYCASRKLDLARLDRLKPWMLMMNLMMVEMQAQGFDPEAGVDRHLARRAAQEGKSIHGLEEFGDQIEVLAGFDRQADPLIANFLDETETLPRTLDDMVHAWRRGDVASLDRLLSTEMRTRFPVLYASLLVERNRRWLPALEQWAVSGQRVMVVVGAGHLVGEDSVIALLRRRGYRVEQWTARDEHSVPRQ